MTQLSPRRFRLALYALYALTITLTIGALHAIAYAQAAPDPLAIAQASVDGGFGLLVTYGPAVGGMYLAYAIGSSLLARYRASSWLAQGKRLAIATSVLGVAGAALQAQVTGAPWTVIAMAGIAAAFKLLTPTVAGAPVASSAPKTAQAGFVSPRLLAILALSVLAIGSVGYALAGCAALKSEAKATETTAIDCAKADSPQAKALAYQLGTEALASVLAGKGVPWTSLEAEAEAAAKTQGIAVGACGFGPLLADITKLLGTSTPTARVALDSASAAAEQPTDPLVEGRAALAQFKVATGVTAIQTAGGVW